MTEADDIKLWEMQKTAPSCSELLAERFTQPPDQHPVQRWSKAKILWSKDDPCAAGSKDELQAIPEEDQVIELPTDEQDGKWKDYEP